MQAVAFKTQDDIFQYLDQVSDVATLPPDERGVYEAALMRARDYNAQMKFARKKAMEEGMAEGRAEGMAQGMAQGMAKGAKLEKLSMVKRLASQGVDLSIIAHAADLSLDEVKDILATH